MIVRVERPVVAFIPPSCCGAGYFHRVRRALADRVDVRAVELPGHGRRYAEPLVTGASESIRDVVAQLDGRVDAVYGESLGSYLALALADLPYGPRPRRLIVASNAPPSVRDRIPLEDLTSLVTAVAALTAMGGEIPPEALADQEVAERVYTVIRADLFLSQSLIDATRKSTVASDIDVLIGADDAASTGLERWATHTVGRCEVTTMPGTHLLSSSNPRGVARAIESALARR